MQLFRCVRNYRKKQLKKQGQKPRIADGEMMALRELVNRIKFSVEDKTLTNANNRVTKYQNNIVATTQSTTALEAQTVASSRNMSSSLGALETAFKAIIGYVFILSSRSLVDLAAQAETVDIKFAGAFYGVEEFANVAVADLTKNYGLSNLQAEQLLANTGDLLKGFGATSQQALQTSTEVQKLAIALGAYNNVPVADASYAVTSALLGEREMIKRLGVVIREADVQQRLLEKGQANLTGQAKLLATAQATLELATEQSTDAVSKFGDLTETNAFKMQQLNAQVQDLTVQIGTYLLPAIGFVSDNFDTIIALTSGFAAALIILKLESYYYATAAALVATQNAATSLSFLTLRGAVVVLTAAMAANPFGVAAMAIGILLPLVITLYQRFEPFRNLIDGITDSVKRFVGYILDIAVPAIEKMIGYAKTAIQYAYMLTPMGMAQYGAQFVQNIVSEQVPATTSAPAPTASTTSISSTVNGGSTTVNNGNSVVINVADTDAEQKVLDALKSINSTNKAMTGEDAFPNLSYQ